MSIAQKKVEPTMYKVLDSRGSCVKNRVHSQLDTIESELQHIEYHFHDYNCYDESLKRIAERTTLFVPGGMGASYYKLSNKTVGGIAGIIQRKTHKSCAKRR